MGKSCCGGGGGGGHGRDDDGPKLNEEQEAISKWVRWNTKTKLAPVKGDEKRDYFLGADAVDKLMDSDFHKKNKKDADQPAIVDREAAIDFMSFMMSNGMFFRAEKEFREKKKKKIMKKDSSDDSSEDETDAARKERKKKKFRLALSGSQSFEDDKEAIFLWNYNPTHPYTWFGGTAIIIIMFAGVLYPLWPSQLRGGVYYLSWGGLGFVGFVIVLAILRTILFGLIWLFSGGKHHLWIFPNLTEDCGPIESFFPLYTYEYKGPKIKKKKKKKALEENEEVAGDNIEEKVVEEENVESPEEKTVEEKKDD